MFVEQHKKISVKILELYEAHEKQISNMIKKINKMFNERLDNLSHGTKTTSDSVKQLRDKTSGIDESLTVNQYLVEHKLNILHSQLRIIKNYISENKRDLKEQLRIHDDRSRGENIRVDSIREDKNKIWENIENTLTFSLHDKLEITEREHTALGKDVSMLKVIIFVGKLFLSY